MVYDRDTYLGAPDQTVMLYRRDTWLGAPDSYGVQTWCMTRGSRQLWCSNVMHDLGLQTVMVFRRDAWLGAPDSYGVQTWCMTWGSRQLWCSNVMHDLGLQTVMVFKRDAWLGAQLIMVFGRDTGHWAPDSQVYTHYIHVIFKVFFKAMNKKKTCLHTGKNRLLLLYDVYLSIGKFE
jgi:hypothetical protein